MSIHPLYVEGGVLRNVKRDLRAVAVRNELDQDGLDSLGIVNARFPIEGQGQEPIEQCRPTQAQSPTVSRRES